jgi:hypothetical protein
VIRRIKCASVGGVGSKRETDVSDFTSAWCCTSKKRPLDVAESKRVLFQEMEALTELSSFTASSTIRRLGFFFFIGFAASLRREMNE